MKNRINSILNTLFGERTVFKAVLLFVMTFSTIQWVHYTFSAVYRGFLVWGALIIVWDFFRGRKLWKGKTIWLLMAFCLFYAVSIYVNRDVEPVKSLKSLAYMGILFVTLYGGAAEPEKRAKERKFLGNEMFILMLILALACLVIYMLGFGKTYRTPDRYIGYLGVWRGRLAGVFNSNTCGAMFSLAILLDLGLLFSTRGKQLWLRLLYGFGLLLFVMCVYLSYSRTSIYTLAGVLALGVFWLLPRAGGFFKKAGKKTVFLSRTAAAVLTILLVIGATAPLHSLFSNLQGIFGVATPNIPLVESQVKTAGAGQGEGSRQELAGVLSLLERAEDDNPNADGELDSMLTGRLSIWKAALRIYLQHPIFGITSEGIGYDVKDALDGTGWGVHLKGGSLHNVYVEVLVSSGTVGAVCLIAVFVIAVVRSVRCRRVWLSTKSASFITLLLLIVFFLVSEMMETRILYRISFFLVFFWMAAGMLREDLMGIDVTENDQSEKRLLSQADL